MLEFHEREQLTRKADRALNEKILEWMKEWSAILTPAEETKIVLSQCNNHIQQIMKYEIRYERHGDTDSPGGLSYKE